MASPEFIQRAYIAFFNRPADAEGFYYWLYNHQGPDQDLLDLFAKSEEYLSDYAGKSDVEIIQTIYQNLFGRDPEPDGLNYWVGQMTAGWITVSNTAYAILGGAQGTDLTAINNKTTAAQAFTDALGTAEKIDAYANAGDNSVGHFAKDWLATVSYTDASVTTALNYLTPSSSGHFFETLIYANLPPKNYVIDKLGLDEIDEYTGIIQMAIVITLSTNPNAQDTIKWNGHFNNYDSHRVLNFDTTSATGQDCLDFTAYGASWLGAATLNDDGYAIDMSPTESPSPWGGDYRWMADSIFPTFLQAPLNTDDTYITLTRPNTSRTEYKIELWTIKGDYADAYYYDHGGAMHATEAKDTAQLIGYVDLGFEIDLSVVGNFAF